MHHTVESQRVGENHGGVIDPECTSRCADCDRRPLQGHVVARLQVGCGLASRQRVVSQQGQELVGMGQQIVQRALGQCLEGGVVGCKQRERIFAVEGCQQPRGFDSRPQRAEVRVRFNDSPDCRWRERHSYG